MKRIANVSACGDPFVLFLLYKLFKERWYEEVSEIFFNINNHCDVPKPVIGEMLAKLSQDPKAHIILHPTGKGNGVPITEGVLLADKDSLIMLLEDDSFIFGSGIVNQCFQKIESDLTDVVGSPRFSCGDEVAEALKKKYNVNYEGYGDRGPCQWPNTFFCKRQDLIKTDLDCGSKAYLPGEHYKELNWTFKEINHTDTFGWMSIQLRALGLRFTDVHQHHADPFEIESKNKKEMNWHPTQQPFKWIHGGSLSAGWGGYLSGRIPDVSNDSAMQEMETRVSFWQIASDVVEGFDDFKVEYKKGIEDLINNSNLDRGRIKQKYSLYRGLLNV